MELKMAGFVWLGCYLVEWVFNNYLQFTKMVYPADELTKVWILLVFDSIPIMVKITY